MEAEQSDLANDGNETTTSGQDMILDQIPIMVDDSVCATKAASQSNGMNQVIKDNRNVDNVVHYIYRHDVVRSNVSRMIGIVTEVAGDSDSDSSITDDEDDEDHDDEEEEDGTGDDEKEEKDGEAVANPDENADSNKGDKSGPLSPDHVRVLWMNDTETTQSVSDVTVVDRGFLHGDYVSAASDPTGQVGVVVDVDITVDLLAPDGAILENVSSRDLKRVREFTVGDYVVLGPWLGRIDDVLDNVMVQFDDGSMCKVMKADPQRLKPITKNLLEDGHFPYYPGQRVRASSSSIFKNSRWLSGLWKANKMEGTVTKVTVVSVFVYWIASAGFGNDSSTAPAEEQSPKNLKLLSCFAHANWQLGDWCLLPSSTLASSVPLDEGLSKLELDNSTKSDLESSHLGSFVDSEDAEQEESNENCEVLSIDPEASSEPDNANERNAEPSESSSSGSSLSVAKEPIHESWPLHRKKIRKVVVRRERKSRKKEENFEKALLIINTKTKVDVAWQDGTIERVESTKLIPVETPGDHDFVAEQYVVEKAADDENYAGDPRRVGVVKSVNAKEKTACVNWLKPVASAESSREFDKEEIVSVYELDGHPDYDYCYGDVVVRLSPVSSSSQDSIMDIGKMAALNSVTAESKLNMKVPPGPTTVEDASQDECCTDYSDLSWVGNITGLKNGDIEVTWADGMVSLVGPQAIYVVGRDDDDESIAAGSGISDAASWETVEDDDVDATQNDKEESKMQNSSDANSSSELEDHSGRNSALSLPLAAIGFVTRLATGIFSRSRSNADIGLDSWSESDQCQMLMRNSEATYSNEEYSSEKSDILENQEVEVEATPTGEAQVFTTSVGSLETSGSFCNKPESDAVALNEDICSFKRFDVARDPVDHYFLGTNAQVHNGRKWFKKVQQDWNILQNNLPDGIDVRVYEDRMDLLRAVLVGAYGTPYQDGLFFFDFHLPPEYPDVPPLAYYHSGGWRINPNLYEEGKVCLSLLNTWTGRGNEVWDPLSSSILQVLVSLQGLVLNSKPYFNEAGYDKQMGTAEGEKNSLSYNENTFLLSCKTMMNLMRKPPKDFEELVKEHFKRRGYYILKACDAYMKGYLIGSLNKDASISNEDNANSTSVGFKLMLAKIAPKLLSALEEVGADCHEFKHLQQS